MTITRHFKDTIQSRAMRDPAFRAGLLVESIECMLEGDMETGKALLRDYINATIGFKELGSLTQKSPKSLMRMFSPDGNPTASNFFCILHMLQQKEGLQFQIRTLH